MTSLVFLPWANIEKASKLLRYRPTTTYAAGVQKFADWLQASRTSG